jgi:CRP/FNR family transcriptional regulator
MKDDRYEIQAALNSLNERAKELNCLYEIDEILKCYSDPVEDIFKRLCKAIPKGWQHVDICRVIIFFDGREYSATDVKKTELRQVAAFECSSVKGEINVYYVKPVRQEHRSIFLPEEQKLLNTIAGKLQQHIEYRIMKDIIARQPGTRKANDNATADERAYLKSLSLTEEQIELFTRLRLNFRKNETICKQGALTNHVFFQTSGLAKAYLESPHDSNFIFKVIRSFDFVGLSSLFGENTYQFTVSALQNTSVYLVEKDIFRQVFLANQDFALHVMKWYSQNYETLLVKISGISSKQSLGRIAEVLLHLSESVFMSNIIESCISRKDIAEMAGLSTESAVRIMSDLKADNIIRTNKSEIEIVNPAVLQKLSQSV